MIALREIPKSTPAHGSVAIAIQHDVKLLHDGQHAMAQDGTRHDTTEESQDTCSLSGDLGKTPEHRFPFMDGGCRRVVDQEGLKKVRKTERLHVQGQLHVRGAKLHGRSKWFKNWCLNIVINWWVDPSR